nr:MAG: hypothetical protein [Bacteriophage sp.]
MQYNELSSELKDLVHHMIIVQMQTNDGIISRNDVNNILDVVSILADNQPSVGEQKVDPNAEDDATTIALFGALDTSLKNLLGALAEVTEARKETEEPPVKPRWRLAKVEEGFAGKLHFYCQAANPQYYRVVADDGKAVDFELPPLAPLMPYPVAVQMIQMYGRPVSELN